MEQILNTISKVYLILESIKESKYKYVAIINPKNGEKIMKIKMNLEDDSLVDFFDTFFDEGFKVISIEKEEFESLKTKDILKINI
ncbi:hypothetical protein N9966_00550 [bacterium]|nr:hypothetical protein [bacterium]